MQAAIPQFARMVILPLALLGSVLAFAVATRPDESDAGATAGFGSVNTPRPINPASDTTNPSARATQNLNPYLGSTPNGEVAKTAELHLSLEDAIGRGLKYNLGLIDSQEASSDARAQREHALAALLPQISARAEQTYQQFSLKSINLILPPQAGIQFPPTSGQYGYSEARVTAQSPILNVALLDVIASKRKWKLRQP